MCVIYFILFIYYWNAFVWWWFYIAQNIIPLVSFVWVVVVDSSGKENLFGFVWPDLAGDCALCFVVVVDGWYVVFCY